MTSRILRPVERMLLDFSGQSTSAASQIFLARRINVAAFKEVTAYIRMHNGTSITNAPATAQLNINADGYTEEDPGAVDNNTLPAFQKNLVNSGSLANATVGQLIVLAVPAPFGSLLSIDFQCKAATGIATLKYVISVDLICKEF